MNMQVRIGLKVSKDVNDMNMEEIRLQKIKAIYDMQYGFDSYQI
jgi:hypothetical protein